jgi:hypothetical protein
VNLFPKFLFQPLEAFVVFAHGADVFLKDNLLSRRGTDDFREPPQVGRVPIGPSCVADIVPEQEGFETELGIFAIADGVCTCPGEIPNRSILHCGDIHRGEIARAESVWTSRPT